jgi:hypothetical protein
MQNPDASDLPIIPTGERHDTQGYRLESTARLDAVQRWTF